MSSGCRVLIAGETWVSFGLHIKGFSAFTTGTYAEGLAELVAALVSGGCHVTHIPNHLATTTFPSTMAELERFDVVILSDIGADTLLLHPDTFERGQRTVDRLQLLVDYTAAGHGLLMVGGYMSFSGFEGKARYQNTALADALPVRMLGYDDRVETPHGVVPGVHTSHVVLDGLTGGRTFWATTGWWPIQTVRWCSPSTTIRSWCSASTATGAPPPSLPIAHRTGAARSSWPGRVTDRSGPSSSAGSRSARPPPRARSDLRRQTMQRFDHSELGALATEGAWAQRAEAELPTHRLTEEIERGLALGLSAAPSINDRSISTFVRGELPILRARPARSSNVRFWKTLIK